MQTGLAARIQRLEDRQDIEDLVVRYGFAVDDHDFERIRELFAPHATLRTKAGHIKGEGLDEVVDYFRTHFGRLGPSNHFVHGHLVEFQSEDAATGLVSSHAEVWRDGVPMLTAMRYEDAYVRHEGTWLFRERVQTYMYFVDVRDYAETLGGVDRIRTTPDSPQPADWPHWHAG
jgi:hypothetical protein